MSMPVCFALLLLPAFLFAQDAQQISRSTVLDNAEAASSLTANAEPFHAEMKIVGSKNEPQYQASVKIDWLAPTKYRIDVRSPEFHQLHIVEGDQIEEHSEGSFYPAWLHSFELALTNPLFNKALLADTAASLAASRRSNGTSSQLCLSRNDRPGGVTDDVTWSGACIDSSGLLVSAYDFNTWMEYSDYEKFGKAKVAHTYTSSTGSYNQLVGKLTSLRAPNASEAASVKVNSATPKEQQIGFTFISTKAEEARLESAVPFQWPPVREGKTDGFMIVQAITDTSGQVRETSKHNSDNPGLEEAGRQAALGYKFKPMLVDGVPVEVEMPLVLHFTSRQADPLPELRGADLLKQIKGCKARLVNDFRPSESTRPTRISVNEQGKLTGESFGPTVDAGNPAVVVTIAGGGPTFPPHGLMFDCHFSPLTVNGVVTYYHGVLIVDRAK